MLGVFNSNVTTQFCTTTLFFITKYWEDKIYCAPTVPMKLRPWHFIFLTATPHVQKLMEKSFGIISREDRKRTVSWPTEIVNFYKATITELLMQLLFQIASNQFCEGLLRFRSASSPAAQFAKNRCDSAICKLFFNMCRRSKTNCEEARLKAIRRAISKFDPHVPDRVAIRVQSKSNAMIFERWTSPFDS